MSTTTTPPSPFPFEFTDPLWAIEHLARLCRVEVDTARELTYRTDFPTPIKIGRRWLWFPAEVLAWTAEQKRYTTGERKRGAGEPAAEPAPAPTPVRPYKPRRKPGAAA